MNALTPSVQQTAIRPVLNPQTFDQLVMFADLAATSGLVPKDYVNKPGAIMIAVQMGSELGLSPMQSIQSIAVINGRPGVWGDGLIGLCRGSPLCQDIIETIEGEGDDRTATCTAIRRGSTPITHTFSVADAKRAGLWQTEARVKRNGRDGPYETANDSPWFRYPDRMLQNRARGFTLRDAFPDVLRGLKTVEELMDTPPDTFRGTTLESTAVKSRPDTRQAINDAVPMSPPPAAKKTARQWLDDIRIELAAATTEAEVHIIATRRDVMQMLDWMKNGALAELQALLAEALDRAIASAEEAAGEGTTDGTWIEPPAADASKGKDLDDEIPF